MFKRDKKTNGCAFSAELADGLEALITAGHGSFA